MDFRRAILAAALAVGLIAACPAGASTRSTGKGVVFTAWNVRNYLLRPIKDADGRILTPPKTAESVDAVVATLIRIAPDIVGLCEIGSEADLADLQKRLRNGGLDLPHRTWVGGADRERHLALLSKYPLESVQNDTTSGFKLDGLPNRVRRGLLDCTIAVHPDCKLRIVGAHLKSRRTAAEFDQADFRREESLVLREHLAGILQADPASKLLVFGDFNDAKNSPVVAGLLGRRGDGDSLELLPLADKMGDHWTYHWAESDEYSRVDHIMVSHALRPLVVRSASRIHREPAWLKASDHRPLVVTIGMPRTKVAP